MRVIVSSTGNSRPSACSAVISTRRPIRSPVPRASPVAMALAQRGRNERRGHLAPDERLGRVAEDVLHGGVDLDDAAAGVDRDHGVERGVEHRPLARLALVHGGLGAAVLDELAGQPAEARERRHQVLVGLARLDGQELHRAAGAEQRDRERRAQAGLGGGRGAREVRVDRHVRDPRRPSARLHPSRQPFAGRERQRRARTRRSARAAGRPPTRSRCSAARRSRTGSQTPP